MSLRELLKQLELLNELIEGGVNLVTDAAIAAQEDVYEAIIKAVNAFEINDGRFVVEQDLTNRIAALQRKIEKILGDIFTPSLSEYLGSYRTVQDSIISLHKSYNDLEVEVEKLSPARKAIYKQAKYYLSEGLADAYIQPAKFLVMQHVTTGISLKDSERILRKWNTGELTAGELASNRPIPNLQKYANQVARDSAYQYSGAIQEVIKDEYELKNFIYTGGIIEDTCPICRHLVSLKREVTLDEVPELIKKYPQGLYPNTSRKNFIQLRGGYNCRHQAFPVR